MELEFLYYLYGFIYYVGTLFLKTQCGNPNLTYSLLHIREQQFSSIFIVKHLTSDPLILRLQPICAPE